MEQIESVCHFGVHDQWAGEHRAAREGCVAIDQSAFGKLVVDGPRVRPGRGKQPY